MLHQEIQLGNPSIGFAFRIFRSERTEQQGSPWRHSPTVAFLGQCSTRFSTGNWSQLSVEAVNAWAGNEPAFPCVHAFFEAVSMFPFCIGSGNGELCLWSRTSAWQTCIAPKDLILERLLEHLLRGSWRHLASLQPGCATTVILSYLPPIPSGKLLGSRDTWQQMQSLRAKTTSGWLFLGAVHI